MVLLRNLCLTALLVAFATATIDCSLEDTCFGEPYDCDPNTECTSLFHFDTYGNLHLFLRNFTDPKGYAAFAVARHPDETIEYFICLPRQKQLLRAIAELGELVLVTENNLSGVVDSLEPSYFRCLFNAIELPIAFEREQFFFVSKGTYDEVLIILDGVQLYNLDRYSDSDEDIDEEETHPVVHHIGSPAVSHRVVEEARSPRHPRSRSFRRREEENFEEEEDRSEEDDLSEESIEEEHRPSHSKSKRATYNPEEIYEKEDYEVPKRKHNKRSPRHNQDEYELKTVDEEDMETDDDLYDNVKNADNSYFLSFCKIMVIGLMYGVLYEQ
ncbi:hypothetical protein CRE_19234 [Caenorhabditis remanei]|uniref:Uncharacterized protein n=1 Tax=Caenorhabditis remanei TaxID=31234 RepID=E3MJM0_CAERE|nr:hypothetical protein CRE_19234 [Caenorhabditis remanei]